MQSHWPAAKFQELVRDQRYSSTGGFQGLVLCDACNLISGRTATISPPHIYDTDNPPKGALYENLFLVELKCDDKTCEAPVLVLAAKMPHYKNLSDVLAEAHLWKFSEDVLCSNGHHKVNRS